MQGANGEYFKIRFDFSILDTDEETVQVIEEIAEEHPHFMIRKGDVWYIKHTGTINIETDEAEFDFDEFAKILRDKYGDDRPIKIAHKRVYDVIREYGTDIEDPEIDLNNESDECYYVFDND